MSEAGPTPVQSSRTASRLAAVSIAIVVAAAAYAAIIEPTVALYRSTQEEIGDARALLDRFYLLTTRTEALAETLLMLEKAVPNEGLFVGGESDAQAAARLQDRIKLLSDTAGVEIITIQALPVTKANDHQRIGLSVRMTADTRLLQQVFHDIEDGAPLLVLDNVFVRARTRSARGAGQHLDVTYDVFGFIRPDGEGRG